MTWATRLLGKAARSLIAWAEWSADPAEREWIRAMRAELDLIEGGLAQLSWAAGALPLLWRAYRVDILRCLACLAAVVAANYAYPKSMIFRVFFVYDGAWVAGADAVLLFFFAQQLYLPLVGIIAAQATRRLLAGTVSGIGLSLLGFVVLHGLVDESSNVTTGSAFEVANIYVQILFFALVGAAFGTLGGTVGLWTSRQTATS